MAKHSITFIVLFLSMPGIYCLTGCHSSSAPPASITFKDERAMCEALKGTWILKEYEDSIDAGCTPKLLEYMLDDLCRLEFTDSACTAYSSFSEGVFSEGTKRTFSTIAPPILFPGLGKLEVIVPRADSDQVDTAYYEISGDDTILRLRRDSTQVIFEKYADSKCPGTNAYSHLVCSKFLAGKYYLAGDTGRRHHIIFTRCGGIEGIENISSRLAGMSWYTVNIAHFLAGPDRLSFSNPELKLDLEYFWCISEDSLILSQNADGKGNPIVLVKAL